jgi:hypothetical protein
MNIYAIIAGKISKVSGQICGARNAIPRIINELNSFESHIDPCDWCAICLAFFGLPRKNKSIKVLSRQLSKVG